MSFISCFLGGDAPPLEPPAPRLSTFVLPPLRTPHRLTTPSDDESSSSSSSSSSSEPTREPSPFPLRGCSPAALHEAAHRFAADVARALAARPAATLDDVLQDACRAVIAQGCLLPPLRTPAHHHHRGTGSLKRRPEGACAVPRKRARGTPDCAADPPVPPVPPLTAA